MADASEEPDIWIPDWGDMPSAPRRILPWLVIWKDGRGSCDPSQAEIMRATGLGESTVRAAFKWFDENGFVKRERRRKPDNTLGGWRLWLDLEKLGLRFAEGQKLALVSQRREASPGPRGPVSDPVYGDAEGGPERGPETGRASPGEVAKTGPAVEVRGPARARPSLHSIPPSFAFRDEDQQKMMEVCIAVCGVGLMPPAECDGLIESLAEALDRWTAEGFDPDLDIVPTVRRQTAHQRVKRVYDFKVLDADVRATHDARLAREAKRVAKTAGGGAPARGGRGGKWSFSSGAPGDDAARKAQRINGFRNVVAGYDRGEREDLIFLLPRDKQRLTDEFLDEALAQMVEGYRREIADFDTNQTAGTETN